MTFQLESMTKVRVLDVRVLASKDRKPDDPPGAQLLLQTTLPIGVLAMFDGFLPGMLYRKATNAKQGSLEGIEASELTFIGDHVKRLGWQYEQTGCEIEIDHGTGGKSNINLADCKAHRVSLSPQQKGVVVQWAVDAPALSDATRGKLTGLKATDIQMTMLGPDVADDPQGDIEGKAAKGTKAQLSSEAAWPFPKGEKNTDAPPQSATTEFVKAHKGAAATAGAKA